MAASPFASTTDTDISRAQFNPLIRPYLVLQIAFMLTLSIVGIPLAIIWVLGLGQWWARHYFDQLDCHLDDKKLRYRKGIFVTVEKTIPLENIQDVTFIEGPILRHFNLSTLKFETAGSGAGQANDMHLTGIIDAAKFRNRILDARDALKHRVHTPPTITNATTRATGAAGTDIAGTDLAGTDLAGTDLAGIERRLDEIIALLKARH